MDRNLTAYRTHRLLAFIYGLGTFAYALYSHYRPNWLTPELRFIGTLLPLLFVIHVLGASGSARPSAPWSGWLRWRPVASCARPNLPRSP